MSNKPDFLLDLCRPTLLQLTVVIAKTLEQPNRPMTERLEGQNITLTPEVLRRIEELNQIQRINVLSDIVSWLQTTQPAQNQ